MVKRMIKKWWVNQATHTHWALNYDFIIPHKCIVYHETLHMVLANHKR